MSKCLFLKQVLSAVWGTRSVTVLKGPVLKDTLTIESGLYSVSEVKVLFQCSKPTPGPGLQAEAMVQGDGVLCHSVTQSHEPQSPLLSSLLS